MRKYGHGIPKMGVRQKIGSMAWPTHTIHNSALNHSIHMKIVLLNSQKAQVLLCILLWLSRLTSMCDEPENAKIQNIEPIF